MYTRDLNENWGPRHFIYSVSRWRWNSPRSRRPVGGSPTPVPTSPTASAAPIKSSLKTPQKKEYIVAYRVYKYIQRIVENLLRGAGEKWPEDIRDPVCLNFVFVFLPGKILKRFSQKILFDKSRDTIRSRLRHAQELWLAERSKNMYQSAIFHG